MKAIPFLRDSADPSAMDAKFIKGLLAVLLLDVLIVIAFSTGLGEAMDYQIASQAGTLAGPLLHLAQWGELLSLMGGLRAEIGIGHVLLLLPFSLVYALFGVSQATSLIPLVIASVLLTTMVVFFVARIANWKAGLLAGFLWAIFPPKVVFSSPASFFYPDVFVLLALLLCIDAGLRSKRLGQRLIYLVLSVGLFSFALYQGSALPWIAALFGFFVWLRNWNSAWFYRLMAALALIWSIGLLLYRPFASATVQHFEGLLASPHDMLPFLPLVIIAAPLLIRVRKRESELPLLLLGITFVMLPLLGSPIAVEGLSTAAGMAEFLWFMLTGLMLAAVCLSAYFTFDSRGIRMALIVSAVALVPPVFALVPGFEAGMTLLTMGEIALGVAIALVLALPVAIASFSDHNKTIWIGAMLAALAIAVTQPLYGRGTDSSATTANLTAAFSCRDRQPVDMPMLVNGENMAAEAQYLRALVFPPPDGGSATEAIPRGLTRSEQMVPDIVSSAYVVTQPEQDEGIQAVPDDWVRLGVYGTGTQRVDIYIVGPDPANPSAEPDYSQCVSFVP